MPLGCPQIAEALFQAFRQGGKHLLGVSMQEAYEVLTDPQKRRQWQLSQRMVRQHLSATAQRACSGTSACQPRVPQPMRAAL
jgi:hypothetical protein